jgi:3-deoxy-D-arabino-heptulosonate 7-phosphate (DAHP) synthase
MRIADVASTTSAALTTGASAARDLSGAEIFEKAPEASSAASLSITPQQLNELTEKLNVSMIEKEELCRQLESSTQVTHSVSQKYQSCLG